MFSICMIMKNEEYVLDRTLASLKPLNAELVIVDTGSNDNSKAIAARYTDKLYDYDWSNDFSAAKNYAASKASNDCILILDADEVLTDYQCDFLEQCIAECSDTNNGIPALGYVTRISYFSNNGETSALNENIPRIYSRTHYHYEGIIHEQLVPIDHSSNNRIVHSSLKLDHYGYYGDENFIQAKTERNLLLLTKMHEDNPEDTYIMYQMGKSYYMRGDYAKAYEVFDKCLYYDVDPKLEYVQDLIVSYAYSMLNTEQYEKALGLEGIYEEFCSCCEYVFVMGLIYMNNGLFDDAIREFAKAASFDSCNIIGTNDYLAHYNIGVILECTGNTEAAAEYYRRCGSYEPALVRLRQL